MVQTENKDSDDRDTALDIDHYMLEIDAYVLQIDNCHKHVRLANFALQIFVNAHGIDTAY